MKPRRSFVMPVALRGWSMIFLIVSSIEDTSKGKVNLSFAPVVISICVPGCFAEICRFS